MKKIIILFIALILVSGCSKKYEGTWCRKGEVFSTLVITKSDISKSEYDYLLKVVKKLENYKSYDVVDDIKDGNTTINIYFSKQESMDSSIPILEKIKGVELVEKHSFEVNVTKLELKKGNYVYGYSLDNVDATEDTGLYEVKDNVIDLNDGTKFYLNKNGYLCEDLQCSNIMQKDKHNSCK